MSELLAFVTVAAAVIATPGQDTALTIRNTWPASRRSWPSSLRAAPTSRSWGPEGVLSNPGNPKMAVFFTSLLPQFGESFPALLGFGLLFCALTLAWLSAYAAVVARAGDFLRRPRVRRALDAVTGAALVALGVRVAAQSRQ